MHPSELAINIRDIIKSIPEERYIAFINELADQMGLQKEDELAMLAGAIDNIRSS